MGGGELGNSPAIVTAGDNQCCFYHLLLVMALACHPHSHYMQAPRCAALATTTTTPKQTTIRGDNSLGGGQAMGGREANGVAGGPC